jgi:tight adherence protein C
MSPSVMLIAAIILICVVVFGIAYASLYFFNPTRTAQDRLRDMNVQQDDDMFEIGVGETQGLDAVAERIGVLAASKDEGEKNKQRAKLVQAGYRHRHALEIFNGTRVIMAMSLPMITLPIAQNLSMPKLAAACLFASAAGYYIPQLVVDNAAEKRAYILLRSFPDCLDLLVSSVEAGLGLDAAFRRVATEMEGAAPELSREFQMVNHEISAGVPRVEALRHLETRTGLDEVRSLVNMLAQAERFGTSVAKSLRVHAKQTRERRMSRAEEEAAKVSPKLTVVMILFLLPVLFSILIGPAAINVMNTFSGG